jgi:Zn-dependent peptidase ImmA (M78 family)
MLCCSTIYTAEQMAADLIDHFNLRAPIDVEGLAETLNLKIYYRDIKSLDLGTSNLYVRGKPGTSYSGILIDENEPWERQRFGIAHEIGHHLILWEGTRSDVVGCEAQGMVSYPVCKECVVKRHGDRCDKQEAWCNRFAAALLMPPRYVEPIYASLQKCKPSLKATVIMAIFSVSVSTARRRIVELKLRSDGISNDEMRRALALALNHK